MSIRMNAMNGPLTYSDSFGSYRTFKYTGLTIGIFCLLFYLVSSYFHKMIGLETIQFIQLIYFVRILSTQVNKSSFYAFNSLKYSNGYNDILSTSLSVSEMKSLNPTFVKLDISLYFLDNCNLMLIPIVLALVGYASYSMVKSHYRNKYI
jgi:hypothetical protein